MGEGSKIEWTDHTFNAWWGCSRVSPGCQHCYAESFDKRVGGAHWGERAERRFFGDKHWALPLRWNDKARAEGVRRRVFCASMADVFEARPELDQHRRRLWDLIEATPWLDWLLLTKRPQNVMSMVPASWLCGFPLNVWVGTTVEDAQRAAERIPHLQAIPATVRFLSCEPLLGPVADVVDLAGIDWVIAGGESGPGARPPSTEWFRDLRDLCLAHRPCVAFHFKQHGEWLALEDPLVDQASPRARVDSPPGSAMVRVGKHNAGRLLDGRTWDEFPVQRFAVPGSAR